MITARGLAEYGYRSAAVRDQNHIVDGPREGAA